MDISINEIKKKYGAKTTPDGEYCVGGACLEYCYTFADVPEKKLASITRDRWPAPEELALGMAVFTGLSYNDSLKIAENVTRSHDRSCINKAWKYARDGWFN